MKNTKNKLSQLVMKVAHTLICSTIIFGAIKASAQKFGTNSGGGGDSVIDKMTGKKKLLDLAEMDEWPQKTFIPVSREYLKKYSENLYTDLGPGLYFISLDYYWSDKVLLPQIQIFGGIAGAGLTATLSTRHLVEYQELKRRLIETKNDDILKILEQRIDKDGRLMSWIFVDFPLDKIDDEGVIRLVDISTKKQLAAQKNGIVAIQKQEFDKLDKDSKAALFLHEAFLFSTLIIKPSVITDEGTSNLRRFVKRFFDYENLFSNFVKDRTSVDEATLMYSHRSVEDGYKKLMKITTQE